jgi:imidazolonepropionase-like amidohydrolase
VSGYRADTAFDGERPLPGGALVLVDGGRIVGVEPAAAPAPAGCEVTHLPGTTLLPGLIDAHVHLCGDAGPGALDRIPDMTAAELDGVVDNAQRAHLAAGVTTVRDLGDHRYTVVDRHHAAVAGPTVVAAGPPVTSVGGHCWSMGGEVATADDIRAAVRERAERGVDVVKVMVSGGVMTTTTDVLACQFTLADVRLLVAEAHRHGLPVTAHAHPVTAVELALDAGVDGIEHATCMTGVGLHTPPELAERLAAAGTFVCPTFGFDAGRLGGTLPPQIRAAMDRGGMRLEDRPAQIAALIRAGVTLVAGVDCGINPGKPHGLLPHAVGELVRCGLSPVAALASATSVAAKACRLERRTGRLRPDLDADLLIVDGDPMTDITALGRPRTVISRGRVAYR